MEDFHHALSFKYELCIGCSHCTSVCPTAAIHVEEGRPVLNPNRCIDCGRCYNACPVNAIYIEQDDFQTIYDYKYPVLLVPSIFSSQFQDKFSNQAILSTFYHLGFKKVYEVERAVNILKEKYLEMMQNEELERPIISSFCPAIVRLIQVKFPSLVSNLSLVRPPLDITALFIKKSLEKEGIPNEDVGVFYISPCAAKIAAIKSPVGEDKSAVDGVINMNYMYNKVLRIIKQGEYKLVTDEEDFHSMSNDSLHFSLTAGEVRLMDRGRNLAIDGVHNVSRFLSKLEDDYVDNIDFLELRACDESCAGGILCAGDRFLTAERQRNRLKRSSRKKHADEMNQYKDYLLDNIIVGKVEPRSMDKLDDDIAVAMRKMKKAYEINSHLPQVDCRICGYQSCKELAIAIVNQKASMTHCIFVQRVLEQGDKLTNMESIKITRKIWGENKVNKNSLDTLNLE